MKLFNAKGVLSPIILLGLCLKTPVFALQEPSFDPDIKKMHERHLVAATHKEAVFLAIDAGIDMVNLPVRRSSNFIPAIGTHL